MLYTIEIINRFSIIELNTNTKKIYIKKKYDYNF